MPTYQYVCTECGAPLEVVQKFSDDALTECPACSGRLRKVFSAAAIVFKGSGFYRTDSRAPAKSPAAASANGSDKSGEAGSSAGSESAGSSESASSGGGKSESAKPSNSSNGSSASGKSGKSGTKSGSGERVA